MSETDRRRALGAERVGAPAIEIRDAIARLASMEHYQRIRLDAVEFYCQRLLCRELISLMDESLEENQLAVLNPEAVKIAFILLLRDMMQTHRNEIVREPEKQNWDTQWIEQFIVGLIYETQAPIQPYQDWLGRIKQGEKEPSNLLIAGLAKQIGVAPAMLLAYHTVACDLTHEEVLSSGKPAVRDRPKKWWQFWK